MAISLIVKRESNNLPCRILYTRRPELDTASQKLEFLSSTKLNQLDFEHIIPDKKHNWIEQSDNDFNDLIPVVDKNTKLLKNKTDIQALFEFFSLGVSTNRDEWVFEDDEQLLSKKMQYFISIYNKSIECNHINYSIKWSSSLISKFKNKGSSLLGMVRSGGINRLNPYLARDLID